MIETQKQPLGIGVVAVGDNPADWVMRSHLPALRSLPDRYRVRAVVGRDQTVVDGVACRVGADHAVTEVDDLLALDSVDVVLVAISTPRHRAIVEAALRAGKHVYCEWPLASSPDEVASISRVLASSPGGRTAIGLQTRMRPLVRHARTLVTEGHIGDVLSVTLTAARRRTHDGTIPERTAYQLDDRNGSGVLEVLSGHAIDTMESIVGRVAEVSATMETRRPRLSIVETGEWIDATVPDHIFVSAKLESGAVASMNIWDGEVAHPRTVIEVNGSTGGLRLQSRPTARPEDQQVSIVPFELLESRGGGEWSLVARDPELRPNDALTTAGASVAHNYRQFADDIIAETAIVADFPHAIRLHTLLHAIRRSSDEGVRVSVL